MYGLLCDKESLDFVSSFSKVCVWGQSHLEGCPEGNLKGDRIDVL